MFVGNKKKRGDKDGQESPGVELVCLMCGKRWMLNSEKNKLALWLKRLEKQRNDAYDTSISK